MQRGQQLQTTDVVLEFNGNSPKITPSSNQFCEMLRRIENNIINIAAKRLIEIRISLGTGALIDCVTVKKYLFIWLVNQDTFSAFSYIRNTYMGSSMDVTRTVFTKAMFA